MLYSGYTFFIILSQLHHVPKGFIYELFYPIRWITNYPTVSTEIYFFFYVVFAFRFLNMKNELPSWYLWSMRALYIIIGYCTVIFIGYLFSKDMNILMDGYQIFTIPMTIYGIVMYIPFFKLKNPLKYYMITGSFILMITSVVSLLYYLELQNKGISPEAPYSILYLGFIIENIIFSLGLGKKQKLIIDERDNAQTKLITQLKENEKLRNKIQEQLEKDVEALNKQAEIEKLQSLQMKYDKELAELKVSALRSQMNPHFIFNSLNSIKRYIIDNEKENAVFYLNKFSKLIRKILASTSEKETSLSEELETMRLYINIENIRFNNGIDFELHYDKSLNLTALKLPSLITQPFLENAIWHGLSLKKDERKLIMQVKQKNDTQFQIDIIDNGVGRKRSEVLKKNKLVKRDSLGIKLSEERLKHFSTNFSSGYAISITDLYENEIPTGTKVSLVIPFA